MSDEYSSTHRNIHDRRKDRGHSPKPDTNICGEPTRDIGREFNVAAHARPEKEKNNAFSSR